MIETELYQHLNTNVTSVGGRISPQVMPQGSAKPALVYTVISDADEHSLEGGSCAGIMRVQIDIYAKTYAEAKTIKEEVKTSLYSFAYKPYELNTYDGFDEEREFSRQIIDFKIRR